MGFVAQWQVESEFPEQGLNPRPLQWQADS